MKSKTSNYQTPEKIADDLRKTLIKFYSEESCKINPIIDFHIPIIDKYMKCAICGKIHEGLCCANCKKIHPGEQCCLSCNKIIDHIYDEKQDRICQECEISFYYCPCCVDYIPRFVAGETYFSPNGGDNMSTCFRTKKIQLCSECGIGHCIHLNFENYDYQKIWGVDQMYTCCNPDCIEYYENAEGIPRHLIEQENYFIWEPNVEWQSEIEQHISWDVIM